MRETGSNRHKTNVCVWKKDKAGKSQGGPFTLSAGPSGVGSSTHAPGLTSTQAVLTERVPALLAAAQATSWRAGEPWPSGAPGEMTESQIQRKFPEALFLPTRCSHAFLKQISVLATGKGEKRSVSLWDQNGQKTFV